MGKRLLFFLLIFVTSFFFGLKNAKAADSDVVINEVMFNPTNQSTGEFIELYNKGISDIDLSNWYFKDNTSTDYLVQFISKNFGQLSGTIIKSNSYALILDSDYGSDYDAFLNQNSSNTIILSTKDKTLGNGLGLIDNIDFYNQSNTLISSIAWSINSSSGWSNYSYEKSMDGNWRKGYVLGGTPGFENSKLSLPTKPKLISPENNEQYSTLNSIDFSWQGDSNSDYEFQLYSILDSVKPLVDEKDLGLMKITVEDLEFGKYYWKVISSNSIGLVSSDIYNLEFLEPVYSDQVIINELLPNPSGDESQGEWIELYNQSDSSVDLSGWQIKDLLGSTNNFKFPTGTNIGSKEYLIFYRNKTGITLNNDSDGLVLLWPNNKITFQTPIFDTASEDSSWARAPDNNWAWTTTPTVNSVNVFTKSADDNASQEIEPVINTVPIEIQTGDYQNYLDKLVKIRGKITSTSGNTFYIDDGSGVVKIYIQSKTGIQKPEMHKNDIFEIVGVVDIYGKTWRILPQNQNDIILIEEAAKVSATVKKAASKVVSVAKTPLVSKAVAAAATSPPVENKDKTNGLSQIVKLIIGLALIALAYLIIKMNKSQNEKTIGGHFGDDET